MSFEIGKNALTAVSVVAIVAIVGILAAYDHLDIGIIVAVLGASGLTGKSVLQNRE